MSFTQCGVYSGQSWGRALARAVYRQKSTILSLAEARGKNLALRRGVNLRQTSSLTLTHLDQKIVGKDIVTMLPFRPVCVCSIVKANQESKHTWAFPN